MPIKISQSLTSSFTSAPADRNSRSEKQRSGEDCATTFTALLGACLFAFSPAQAQTRAWPERPVKIVVPAPAGSSLDLIVRAMSDKLGARWSQPVVVENKPGAAGTLGADLVAKAPPDGYTLLMGAMTSHSINAALSPATVPFDIEKSFAPVSIVGTVPLAVMPLVMEPEPDSVAEG